MEADVKTTKWCGAAAAIACVLGVAVNAGAQAKGPAFDCAKAEGTVQKMVCSDEKLGALDRQLDGVYKAAVAKAKGPVLNTLKAEQRGWIKGRDDCWKATQQTWLTESWTVSDVRSCVDGQYQLRIAELQVMYQLVPSKPAVSYACNNNPANEVVAQFFDSTPLPAARFERGDQTVVGYLIKTASGAKYEGRNLSFWNKGSEATVKWLAEELACKAR
jgi:uncharacterized protein